MDCHAPLSSTIHCHTPLFIDFRRLPIHDRRVDCVGDVPSAHLVNDRHSRLTEDPLLQSKHGIVAPHRQRNDRARRWLDADRQPLDSAHTLEVLEA